MIAHATSLSANTWSVSSLQAILTPDNIAAAWDKVRASDGAPGIDRVSVARLALKFDDEWARIRPSVLEGSYRPSPVRCVDIPKPGGGTRTLGIPTVMDRVIQQALAQILTSLWEPTFSQSCHGYRPGRGARDAVLAAERLIEGGLCWVVDLDIEKFFDRINHKKLLDRIAIRTPDSALLGLIRSFLEAGAFKAGFRIPTPEGIPQGSPLSPLLANIVLDEFDKELERVGRKFVRYADDTILFAASRTEGMAALEQACQFLRDRLALTINLDKTRVVEPHEATFLGFTFARNPDGTIRREIAIPAIEAFKAKVAELALYQAGRSFDTVLEELGDYVRGWTNYFKLCETPNVIPRLRSHARGAARRFLWCSWGTPARREKELIQRGISAAHARRAVMECADAQAAAASPALGQAIPNAFFDKHGLADPPVATSQPYLPTRKFKQQPAQPHPSKAAPQSAEIAHGELRHEVKCDVAIHLGQLMNIKFGFRICIPFLDHFSHASTLR